MVSLKVTFVAALLLANIVDQVYSRNCYACSYNSVQGTDKECKSNPAQSKYVKSCSVTKEAGVDRALSSIIKDPFTITAKADDYNCAVLEGTYLGETILARGCMASSLDCESVKAVLPTMKLEKCSICSGDLCNASSKAGIAIFTLMFCLTGYFIFQ